MKENKFTKFIYDNDIKTSNEAYVISKIPCSRKDDNGKVLNYLWFKLLQVKCFEKDGQIVRQIYVLDFFTYNIDAFKDVSIGSLVQFELSTMVGRKCSIVNIKEI